MRAINARVTRALLTTAVMLAPLVTPAAAQDAHYWTIQYGNRARLLGGSVIGSVLDLSAVYYNPGAIALIAAPEILLAGNAYQYSNVKWEDAYGNAEYSASVEDDTVSASISL